MSKYQLNTVQKDSSSSETGVTADAILKDSVVFNGMKRAYLEAQNSGIETGGWIFFNDTKKVYAVVRTNKGAAERGIILDKRFAKSPGNDWALVGNFHAHPGYGVPSCKPSHKDVEIAKSEQCHMFVIHSTAKPKKERNNSDEWEETRYSYDEGGKYKEFIISHILDSKERMLVRQKLQSLEHQETPTLTSFRERQMQKHNGIVPKKSQDGSSKTPFQKNNEFKKADYDK